MSVRVEDQQITWRLWPEKTKAEQTAKALGADWKAVLHSSQLGWYVENSNGERRDVAGKVD